MKSLRNWLLLSALALPGAAPAHDQSAAATCQPPSAASAPIALLADLSSGQILFARDANRRFLPASMTKAMTALPSAPKRQAGGRGRGRPSTFLDPSFVAGEARVQGGDAWRVQLGLPRRYAFSIPRSSSADVSATIDYDGPLRAPLAKGQQVARLIVRLAGQPDHVLPLVALDDVGPAGPIDRIANGLLGLFE